jgi:F-type H+-transporting ATPase subunit epsilon
MKNYLVDILTPDKVISQSLEANSIMVETVRGEINILPEHTHLVTSLFTGLLRITDSSKNSKYFTVSKGICKVLGNKITILSSYSLTPSEVDKDALEKENAEIQAKLQKTDLMDDLEIDKLYDRLDYNNAAIKLVNFA